ncbi:Late embryogenesis abundant protein [Parasponia andersonii]|uniref:Late embryogenesis abundant protein n=1 Tax=Parasponia andersonii TaxID=3476 RepID=A0A2P5CDV2_PARAD|nr:Late embryogenesis abundant protein [Parasponia andersonii]
MTDRVYPRDSPQTASPHDSSELPLKLVPPSPERPIPSPGTYVIQIPKDQVYRVPPPENSRRLQQYARRKDHRSRCRACFCGLLAVISALILLAGVAAAVLYLVYRPESPKYAVDSFAIKGINVSSPAISPAIDVTVRAENPNNKIGIYYGRDSSATVYYSDVELCNGVIPRFYQPSNNVTVLKTALTGPRIELTSSVQKALRNGEKQGKVPLKLKLKIPVKMKVGSVKTWTIAVKVRCDVTVDTLTAKAKIVSNDCDYSWKPWW